MKAGMPLWRSVDALGAALLSVLVILNYPVATGSADHGCATFRHLENGRTFFRYAGLYVTFSCNPGFKIHGHHTSSCVSGQWARDPPLCVAAGCPSPGKPLHGTAAVSPDSSLVRFKCDVGFRLFGPSLLYCKGDVWNGSIPVCKESDIMSLFQLKETSSSYSTIASPKNKLNRTFSRMFGMTSPKPDLAVDFPNTPERLYEATQDTGRTLGLKETSSNTDILREQVMKLDIPREPTRFVDALHRPLPTHSPTVSTSTLLNAPLLLKPEATVLITATKDKQQEESSTLLDQIKSSSYVVEARTGNQLILTNHRHHKHPVTASSRATSNSPLIFDLEDTTSGSAEPMNSGLSEILEASINVPSLEVSLDLSPTSISELSGSGNDLLSSNSFVVRSPSLFGEPSFWETSESGNNENLLARMKSQTSVPDLHLMVSAGVAVDSDLSSNTKMKVNEDPDGHIEGELKDMTRLDKTGPPAFSTLGILGFSSFQTRKRRPVCPYPPVPTHGTFYFRTKVKSAPLQYKHYIQYACYAGYTLANGDVYSYCLQDGRWSGVTPMCIVELAPCSLNHGGCSQLCRVNGRNQSECHCNPGFLLLEDRHTCRDLDECVEGRHECQQLCENTFGSYRCSCRPGFQISADGMSCTDVNECLLSAGLGLCVFGCVNTPGSFHCRCPAGYAINTTDGRCTDIDECMENGGRGPCESTCLNTPGSFHCGCQIGHQLAGDGRSCVSRCAPGYHVRTSHSLLGNSSTPPCVDIDECKEMEQRPQDWQHRCEWKCVNLPGTHHCICPRGYTKHPNGYHCRDIDECLLRNGGCSHICVNHRGGFKCACPENHRISPYNRRKCQPIQDSYRTVLMHRRVIQCIY